MTDFMWLDYSFARPPLADMKSRGVKGVLRYICPDTVNTHGKILFLPERDLLFANGFDIALNYEWYEGRCNEGRQSGLEDGATGLASASALGYPKGKVIYYSHDTGVYNWAEIEAYFRALHEKLDGHYSIGAYGSLALIKFLHDKGLIVEGWQTIAWSNGGRDPWAEIYQNGQQLYNGGADVDIVTGTTIGSWLDSIGGLSMADVDTILTRIDLRYNALAQFIGEPTHPKGGVLGAVNALQIPSADDIATAVITKLGTTGSSLTADEIKTAVKEALKEGTGV